VVGGCIALSMLGGLGAVLAVFGLFALGTLAPDWIGPLFAIMTLAIFAIGAVVTHEAHRSLDGQHRNHQSRGCLHQLGIAVRASPDAPQTSP
jgi:hypothetical protein